MPAKLTGARVVQKHKITDYLLNQAHPEGGPKARFFIAVGFDSDAPDLLANALYAHPEENTLTAQFETGFGLKSVVECRLATPDGRNSCIRSIWYRETGSEMHRLVSAYPFGRD